MAISNYWRLNGNSTNQAGGTSGTDANITYLNDYASFNGSTSTITCGTAIQPWTADFICSMMFKTSQTWAPASLISNNNGGNYYSFNSRYTADWSVGMDIFAATQSQAVSANNGNWRFIVFWRFANTLTIYVDDKKYVWAGAGANNASGGNTVIWGRPFDTALRFSGGIKEIKYDSVVWTEAWIRNEYARLKWFF